MARKKHEQAVCGVPGAVTITVAAQMLGLVDTDGKPKRTLVRYYATQDKLRRVAPICTGCRMVLVTLESVRRLQDELTAKTGTPVVNEEATEAQERLAQEQLAQEVSDDPWADEI